MIHIFLYFCAFWGYHVPMKTQQAQQALPLNETRGTPSTIHINGRSNYREEGDMRVVFANGIPLFHYAMADKAAAHYSMVQIVESGLASQQEVAAAFNCSRLTIFRSQKNLEVTDNELRVTLNPLSSPHRSKAIGTLCEKLNTTDTIFPGSKLRLVYGVKEHAHVTQK